MITCMITLSDSFGGKFTEVWLGGLTVMVSVSFLL